MSVHIGFFRDFKSTDTLLIDGDSSGVRELANVFRRLADGGGSVAIHELPFVEAHGGVRVVATTGDRDVGASTNGLDISWKRSRGGWQDVAERLYVLHRHLPDITIWTLTRTK